jgi:hypothetical protein
MCGLVCERMWNLGKKNDNEQNSSPVVLVPTERGIEQKENGTGLLPLPVLIPLPIPMRP